MPWSADRAGSAYGSRITPPTMAFRPWDSVGARVNTDRKIRNLIRQLEALGHTVTLQPAA
jgi:transposase